MGIFIQVPREPEVSYAEEVLHFPNYACQPHHPASLVCGGTGVPAGKLQHLYVLSSVAS